MSCFFSRSKLKKYKILGEFGNILVVNDKKTLDKRILKKISKKLDLDLDILVYLNHKNIIKVYSIFKERGIRYMVMEDGGSEDLFDYMISRVPFSISKEVKNIISQILNAVSYLHKKGITHRDIKPENIIVNLEEDTIRVKLIDFDFASCEERMCRRCGTLYYIAPEILDNRIEYYNSKCDIWSVGIILYLFLYGKFPFNGKNDDEISDKILNLDLLLNLEENCSNFLLGLLNRNVNMRLSANLALSHDWLVFSE